MLVEDPEELVGPDPAERLVAGALARPSVSGKISERLASAAAAFPRYGFRIDDARS